MQYVSPALRAIFAPERAFEETDTFLVPRVFLFFIIIIPVFAGGILSAQFHNNEVLKTLTIMSVDRRIDRIMGDAPEEDKERARARALGPRQSEHLPPLAILGLAAGSLVWIALIFELRLFGILLMQFFGGEEAQLDGKKHRRSLYLASYALIPVAFQEAVRGIILSFKDPQNIGNVLTIEKYREATGLSMSLLSLFELSAIPRFAEYIALSLTNPFYLWALAIALLGGHSVYKIKTFKMAAALAIIIIFLSLQNQLIDTVQNIGIGL